MNDLLRCINTSEYVAPEFINDFDNEDQTFKFGALLKEARKEAGLTQTDIATYLHTQKSAISRIENHAEDVKLSTLERFASALGKKVVIRLV